MKNLLTQLTVLVGAAITIRQGNCFINRLNQPISIHSHPKTVHFKTAYKQLAAGQNNDNELETKDNFDAKGLANYLGPYALALLVSLGVTAAFVKFVLMDY
jgi:hypothetical protein